MTVRLMTSVVVLLCYVSPAPGQQRLSGELSERIRAGIDQLSEDELLTIVPGPVTVEFDVGAIEADYALTWEEVRRIRVEFLNGKVASAAGTFSDAVASKTLTLANLKKISKDLPLKDVEKLLSAERVSHRSGTSTDRDGREIHTATWEQGRMLKAYVQGGKVHGLRYVDTTK